MSEVVAFRTHPSFEGKMETTLEGFIKRVKLWLEQRNGYDADHGATKYFELRLSQLVHRLVQAETISAQQVVAGIRHNFDEEGNSYIFDEFRVTLEKDNGLNWHAVQHPTDPEMHNRCKHFIYHLVPAGNVVEDWETDVRPVWEESIPNADVESIIGNLLMMHQIPGMNLYELTQVLRTMLAEHRIELFLKDLGAGQVFYLYTGEDQVTEIVSAVALDYEENDRLMPLKPTVVDSSELFNQVHARVVATHKNRRTLVISSRV